MNLQAITEEASRKFGIGVADIKGRCRKARHVCARRWVITEAFLAGAKPPKIADFLGMERTGVTYTLDIGLERRGIVRAKRTRNKPLETK